jgi:hypothetical protein
VVTGAYPKNIILPSKIKEIQITKTKDSISLISQEETEGLPRSTIEYVR